MITLREINKDNFRAVIALKVSDQQQSFVATNVYSIAESKIYPYLIPKGLYSEDELIGFTLFGRDPDLGSYWIVRLMIDAAQQGKGYGKAATKAIVEHLTSLPDCNDVFLSFVPGNDIAEKVYQTIGFRRTGEVDESGEIIMRYSVSGAEADQMAANVS